MVLNITAFISSSDRFENQINLSGFGSPMVSTGHIKGNYNLPLEVIPNTALLFLSDLACLT